MEQTEQPLGRPLDRTRQALRTPRAAAVAGIFFAVLFATSLTLIRLVIPEEISGAEANTWLSSTNVAPVQFGLLLVPFAGIAFLWFMGVIRDHLGNLEDRFFSTVFFGSGLLFLSMMFTSAALAGGLISTHLAAPGLSIESDILNFGRLVMYTVTNVYAIRMAGVFMLSQGTIWVRTRLMPRPFVILTYILAISLLVAINVSLWAIMVFPAWVLAISLYILWKSLRGNGAEAVGAVGSPN